ncbi:MAG: hypothetical protein R2876_05060 [Eubacteriales bacterium]
MARDLRSMKNGGANTYGTNTDNKKENDQMNKDDFKTIQDAIFKYQGKSETELFSELSKMADKEKKEGSFNIDAIKNFAKTAGPMLSPEQREKMNAIIEQLK